MREAWRNSVAVSELGRVKGGTLWNVAFEFSCSPVLFSKALSDVCYCSYRSICISLYYVPSRLFLL